MWKNLGDWLRINKKSRKSRKLKVYENWKRFTSYIFISWIDYRNKTVFLEEELDTIKKNQIVIFE
jgi:hypothetical protein